MLKPHTGLQSLAQKSKSDIKQLYQSTEDKKSDVITDTKQFGMSADILR